jgi:hypothetical protein
VIRIVLFPLFVNRRMDYERTEVEGGKLQTAVSKLRHICDVVFVSAEVSGPLMVVVV